MMHSIPQRVVIYAKDVENITGMKNRTARRLLQKVREQSGKTNQELVTVQDFCKVTGIPEDVVRPFLMY
jgi:Mg2+/Co2+ transporter CorB